MQRLLTWILVAVASVCGTLSLDTLAASAPTKGVIRVKLSPESAREVGNQPRVQKKGKLSTGVARLDKAAQSVKAVSIRPMLPYSAKFAAQRAKYGLDRWYVVSFDESVSSLEARKLFAAAEGVERSEVVTPMVLREGTGKFRIANPKAIAKAAAGMPFNDPMLPNQWHYRNDGSIPYSVEGADINLFEAWKTATGSPDVLVAIIDGGIDYTHEDLARNLFVNTAELSGEPGVDDDGNGYVDDVYGYNFCTSSGEIYPHSHGTHVAGTVGAVNNNSIGVAGVAGGDGSASSGVRMLSCQVFDSRSGAGEADFAAAIVYAAEMGATIAQCSWGWEGDGYYEQSVLDAIDYFTETARSDKMTGGLCIFAGGNAGLTGNFYPAAYDKVVGVAAMTSELTPASYSNNGPWVDVTAPGGLLDYGDLQGVLSTLPGNKYGYNEGTSMATPHVSGIAALILSKYGSPTFTNESLRTQLVTSVNDFYGFGNNSRVEGNFGSGYIDAAKALRMGDTSAPGTVTDFDLLAAQDNITVTWTIPESSDGNVNNHIVYWSEQPFSASDLSKVRSVVVDTKFQSSGDTFSYEIAGLKSMTPYYVALAAVNRWGNASPLSEVKSATTNEGPQMTVSVPMLDMSAAPGNPGTASFLIGNDADGLLKWQVARHTVSAQPFSVARPVIGKVTPYSGTLGYSNVRPMAAPAATPEYVAEDYPKDICYWTEHFANIGETDKTLPNSMAQWFRVDAAEYPEGFNLTHVSIDGANGLNPVIEIYKGGANISQATLLQRIRYDFFVYGYNIALNEQIFFAPGESFWIVVHFDPGQDGYPLGMAIADRDDIATYSYMSTDKGASWTQLAAALKDSPYENMAASYTWAVKARSLNPDWSSLLEIDPESGSVRKGETQEVTLKADASNLVNGYYAFNLTFDTNETEAAVESVPVSLQVSGNKPSVKVPKVVDFGSMLVGQTKTLTVEVFNAGYGSFRGSDWGAGLYENNISSSSPDFAGPAYVTTGFPARTSVRFELSYTPTAAGSHHGTVTFRDVGGNEVRILVQGAATDPAKLAIEPAVIDAGTLTVGDEPVVKQFSITNEGKYPLEYVFPKFSSETIDGQSGSLHQFGYSVFSSLEGFDAFEYDGNPDLIGATDIAKSFSDDVYVSQPVSLGFSFPYYGKNYSQIYVTSFGGVMFATNDVTMRTPLTPDDNSIAGTGLISAYGSQLMMGPSSKVEYARNNGKFTVAFRNVLAPVYDQEYIPVSFHISLSSNGDIEIFYDDYMPMAVFQDGSNLFLGINDPEQQDALTLTSSDMADYWGLEEPTPDNSRFRSIMSGTAVKFEAPKPAFVRSLSAPYGLVSPGETVTIDATLSADASMNAGETFNTLTVITNDPAPAVSSVRLNAVIAGDCLVAEPVIENTDVDFGKVFRTSDSRVAVTVTNAGHDTMTVTSASLENDALSVVTELPVEIPAGFSRDIVLAVNTDKEGAVNDRLNVATTAGNLSAVIRGEVIGCPEIELGFSSVSETVASGDPLVKTLEISNNGNEPLEYSFSPAADASISVPEREDSKTSYVFSSSVDGGAKADWIDVETNGLGVHNSAQYYMNHDYVTVELPFEFPFYGKKYSKMYVYNTGFVSFTERHDDKIWPEPPAEFPEGSIYTNIIAPYWGLHSMDTTPTAGTFHYVTDDRVVVSFMEYGNSMNIGVCYQLVMEKDGSFRFLYKAADANAVIFAPFGLAGIANADGSESIRLAERQIAFGNTVRFSPVTELSLAPGAKDEVVLTFDTDRMAGFYESTLTLNTNVPSASTVEIPVALTVTGEAKPVFPENLTVENTLGFRSSDRSNPLVQLGACYDAPFEIRNEGTANMTITGIDLDVPMIQDPFFPEWSFPAFSLLHYAQGIDWITGEPTDEYNWSQYYGDPVVVGRTPAKFSIPMMEGDFWMTPGTYEIPMTFHYYLGDDFENTLSKDFKVTFVVTQAPAMTLSKEEIRISNADDDHSSTETLAISNEGEYKLSYSLRLDASGVGEEEEESGGGIAPMQLPAPGEEMKAILASSIAGIAPLSTSSNIYDMPQDVDLTNALFHAATPGNNTVYNYGSNNTYDMFKAAVAYTAPEEGFNLSHIYTCIETEGNRNVEISYEIIQGSNPAGEVVLGRASLMIASQNSERFYLVKLDKPVYLNPGEEFCVVATYPQGLKLPAYLCFKEESVVTGRYMGWTPQSDWYDVAELFKDSYGSLGYIMSCIETEPGEPWVKLLNEKTEGEIAPGESLDVNILVNAAAARMEKGNKAMLVIKSNDPAQPLYNFPIWLDMNGAPVIERPSGTISVKEGEKATVTLTVADPDLDDYTVELDDASGIASLISVTAAEGDSAEILEIEGADKYAVKVIGATEPVTATVSIAPEFGDAAENLSFALKAADDKAHEASATVLYDVVKVNRAPVAVGDAKTVDVGLGMVSNPVNFSDYASDPDGDLLVYELGINALGRTLVDAYTTSAGVVFMGKKLGKLTATVTATDPDGLSVSVPMEIEVKDLSGVAEIEGDGNGLVTITNRIFDGMLDMKANFSGRARFEVFDAAGASVYGNDSEVSASETISLNLGDGPTGVYLLRVSAGDKSESYRIFRK